MERGKAEKREELSDEEFVAGLGITPLTEEERSLVEDVHDILSGAGYIFDAADLLDALVYVFEGDFKNAALSSLAAVPIVGSGVKAVKVLKNAAEVAGVLAGAKKLVDAAFEGRKAAKAAKAAEEAAGSSKAGVKTITEVAGEKADILAQNCAQGRAYKQKSFIEFNQNFTHSQEQITVKTQSSVKTRLDAIGFDADGKIVIHEFKSSIFAPLTRNQKFAFPEIFDNGATVLGKGKGIFTGGYSIPAGTDVKVIRPPK